VREDPKVISAYLGEGTPERAEEPAAGNGALPPVGARVTDLAPVPHETRKALTGNLLEVTGLRAGYGGIEVIRDIDLHVAQGEVVACIGANGAGKTTTLRAISGMIRPTKGKVVFDGHDIFGKPAQNIVRLGMVHIPQGRGLFPRLTVEDTLRLASYSGQTSFGYDEAFEAFPVLKDRLHQLVGTLSGGQQQMLAMARALLVKPKLLLLDEMSQGLAPAVVQQLFERIHLFRQQGTAVFLVEQFVDSALAVADRAYVYEQGSIAHEAPASVLRQDQAVIASSYLGTALDVEAPTVGDGAARGQLLEDISIKLPAEVKRSIEERAAKEGKPPEELVLSMLSGGKPSKGGE
jgi:branched-chain amino acid transport system ATP-binding protein